MNPFIRLLEAPVQTLTLLGYLIIMTGIILLGLSYTLRRGTTLAAATAREYRQGRGPYQEWWGEWGDGWVPPAGWTVDAMKVLGVVTVLVWALATVAYMVS